MFHYKFSPGELCLTKEGPENEVISTASKLVTFFEKEIAWMDGYIRCNEFAVFIEERIPNPLNPDARYSLILSLKGPVWVRSEKLRKLKT